MIMELTNKAHKLGYKTTHMLIDGQFAGLNHSRKRFFFIATKYGLSVPRLNFSPAPTTGEVLDSFKKNMEMILVLFLKWEKTRSLILNTVRWEKV